MLNPSKYTLNVFKCILEGLTLKIEVYMEEVEGLDTLALKKLREKIKDKIIRAQDFKSRFEQTHPFVSQFESEIYAYKEVIKLINETIGENAE